MKQERRSRYENPKVETANRFDVLREAEGSGEEMKGHTDGEDKETKEVNKDNKGKSADGEKNKKDTEMPNEGKEKKANSKEDEKDQMGIEPGGNREDRNRREEIENRNKAVRFEGGGTMSKTQGEGEKGRKD